MCFKSTLAGRARAYNRSFVIFEREKRGRWGRRRTSSRASDQPLAAGPLHGLVAVAGVELGEDVAHVALDRVQADAKRVRDLLVQSALGDEAQDLLLARGQGRDFPFVAEGGHLTQAAELFQDVPGQRGRDGRFPAHGSS